MAAKNVRFGHIAALVLLVGAVLVALPQEWRNAVPLLNIPQYRFGLDLAGGTQLDFRISEEEIRQQVEEIDRRIGEAQAQGASAGILTQLELEKQAIQDQQQNLMEAIRTVLERRINALGVSEATITPSYIGNEKHLLVDCPGVVDTQQCIDTVGKTIQLEFKEEFDEATEGYEELVVGKVRSATERLEGSGATLETLGQDLSSDLGVAFIPEQDYPQAELPAGLEDLWVLTPEQGVVERRGELPVPNPDNPAEIQNFPGIFLAEAIGPRTTIESPILEAQGAFEQLASDDEALSATTQQEIELTSLNAEVQQKLRTMEAGRLEPLTLSDGSARILFLRLFTPGREVVDVSHILVAYEGSAEASDTTLTKEQAQEKAQNLRQQITNGASFEELARTESDSASGQNGGSLGEVARGSLVPAFEDVAFSQQPGTISDVIETPFGFHIIRTNAAPTQEADLVSYDMLTINGENASVRASETISLLEAGGVTRTEDAIPLRLLFFSLVPTGWKDTELDGTHFRTANVVLDSTTNRPVVQILFDDEGGRLFQELTKRNIGRRIAIFVGGQLVSAPVVQAEIAGGVAQISGSSNIQEAQNLAQDLNTGAIPAPIFLTGQRTVEASLGQEALQTSIQAAAIGLLVVIIYLCIVYRFLGMMAAIALLGYVVLLLAFLKLPLFLVTDQYIVLTLAGIAGLMLSAGLAIDLNVLVFERMKEELKAGRSLRAATDIGFERAWPSIRDSNVSTLISCALLFIIGTSIVRGFAITLALGVIISMFTGMIVLRWLLRSIAKNPPRLPKALLPWKQ